MQSVIFTDRQGEKISKITGKIMSDEAYKMAIINAYYVNPSGLSIFAIYALEHIIKKCGEFEFNLGYLNILERYAGEDLNHKTYDEYDNFITNWNSDAFFRNAIRKKFDEGQIGALSSADFAAYRIVKITEENLNKQNNSHNR